MIIFQESQPAELIEDVEIIPVQQIAFMDGPAAARYPFQSLADALPADRWYETDGVAPALKCPV